MLRTNTRVIRFRGCFETPSIRSRRSCELSWQLGKLTVVQCSRWKSGRGIRWKGARDILVGDTALNSRGGVVRALVDGDHFLEVSANQRWARIPRERRSWRLVGVRPRSAVAAVRLRSAHVCRVLDVEQGPRLLSERVRVCLSLCTTTTSVRRYFLVGGAVSDPPALASPVVDATIRRENRGSSTTAWTPPGPGPTVVCCVCPGTHTASCFPRVKARAASHRACASSSVRHDTTSLPFFSFFLTLPTPPPRSSASSVSLWPRFLLTSRDDSWGEARC